MKRRTIDGMIRDVVDTAQGKTSDPGFNRVRGILRTMRNEKLNEILGDIILADPRLNQIQLELEDMRREAPSAEKDKRIQWLRIQRLCYIFAINHRLIRQALNQYYEMEHEEIRKKAS